jgi:hypothetical protein
LDKEEVVDLPDVAAMHDEDKFKPFASIATITAEISQYNLKPSASVASNTEDKGDDKLKHSTSGATINAVNKSLSSEVSSIDNSCQELPTIHKHDVEAVEKKDGVYISSEIRAYEPKDNPDSVMPSKLGTATRNSIESTGKENVVPEICD